MAHLRKQSQTAHPLQFLLVQSSDHVTPLTGATPTVTISKNGGSFAAPAGTVTQIGNGWYQVAGNATDTNTLGPLLLHATAASGDPTDVDFQVVAFDPDDAAGLGLSRIDAAVTTRSTLAAGAAMTLTGAYDAAKTAAAPGAQMDLVSAPNATAVTAIQTGLAPGTTVSDLTTIIANAKPVTNEDGQVIIAPESLLDLPNGVETGWTLRQVMRLIASVLLGKSSNGGATFRDLNDTKARVTATVDSSDNRTAVTKDAT